jgi:ScaI restriction endonuclease
MESPYKNIAPLNWHSKTQELISKYPLKMEELVDVVKVAWADIFATSIGTKGFRIGTDIFPKPQIIAFFLHELIPLELQARYPNSWRGEVSASDKDIVYVPDEAFSIEIKTSSHPSQIFGNRSYAQKTITGKKSKSGYYLAVNFGKTTKGTPAPILNKIRFGWLDHSDWQGQIAASGQQARLSPEIERGKLISLFDGK